MGHRVSWLRRRLGLDLGRIVDTCVLASPLSREAPGLSRLPQGAPPAADRRAEGMEGAKLSDLIEDMEQARVAASLVVLHKETDEFFRLASKYPGRLFGLAYYDSLSPRRALEGIQGLCNNHPDLILGVTTAMLRFGEDPRLRDFVPLYEFCAGRGLPVQFYAGGDATEEESGRPMALAVLAKSYPRLKVVGQYHGSWRGEAFALLNRFGNLFLQVDGLSLSAPLRAADSRKLLFGSDRRGREPGYFERVEAVRRLPWWRRRNVGWRTAVRLYGSQIVRASACPDPQPSSR